MEGMGERGQMIHRYGGTTVMAEGRTVFSAGHSMIYKSKGQTTKFCL